jgi:small GTP-binding protein
MSNTQNAVKFIKNSYFPKTKYENKIMTMYVMKTIVAGDGGIGKSTIVKSFMNEVLSRDYKMTIGVDIFSKTININEDSITFSVHDIAGQHRFSDVKGLFMRGTQLGLFVFDLTRKDSLVNLRNNWIPPLIELCDNVVCVLIGNKSDLEDLRVFDKKEVEDFFKVLQKDFPQCHFVQYIETSAIHNKNIDLAFHSLAKTFLKINKK